MISSDDEKSCCCLINTQFEQLQIRIEERASSPASSFFDYLHFACQAPAELPSSALPSAASAPAGATATVLAH